MTKQQQTAAASYVRGKLSDLTNVPGLKRNKHRILASLPEVQQAKEDLEKGLAAGEFIKIRLDPDKMTQMKIVTGGRLVKNDLKGFIERAKIKAKDGKPLTITRFTDESGAENVMVAYPSDAMDWGYGRRKKKKGSE